MNNELAFILIFIALTGGTAFGYGIKVLRSEWDAMKKAVDKQRNPYRTNDGLEDAMSIAHDITWQALDNIQYLQFRAA